jgi:hypothetical protein
MTAKTAARLREQILDGARALPNPFAVVDLVAGMPDQWPSTTVDRMLRTLVADDELSLIRSHPMRMYVVGRPDAATLADPAPDWDRRYPSKGNRIGPTWQALWEHMAAGEWCDVRELLQVGEQARDCATLTVRNLLFAAAKARLIEPEARQDEKTGRWRIWYRRPDRVLDKTEVGI